MKKVNLNTYILYGCMVLVILFLFKPHIKLRLWGPKNYNECVLKEMRGQHKTALRIIKKVCEERFPYEKRIWIEDDIEWKWKTSETLSSKYPEIQIKENYSNYSITKINATINCSGAYESPLDSLPLLKTNNEENKKEKGSFLDDVIEVNTEPVSVKKYKLVFIKKGFFSNRYISRKPFSCPKNTVKSTMTTNFIYGKLNI